MLIKLKKLREFVSHLLRGFSAHKGMPIGYFHAKIRTQLFLLILITGILCLSFFRFLWHKKWTVYYFLAENLPANHQLFPMPADDFWMKLDEEASKYNLPDSEDDRKAVHDLDPFFSLADEYTSISIYGLEDGLYRAGCSPKAMIWNAPFRTFFQFTYRWIDEDVNQNYTRPIKFNNGYGNAMISFYHSSFFVVPYGVFCLFLCVFLFLSILLFFVGRKLKTVAKLEKSILQMSTGDLTTPIPGAGFDELGILSLELDKLRLTLHENILKEQKLHKSNQELIAALSHDLRTPLTILKGYLEIVRLNQNPDMQTEYVNRCFEKTEEIQEMTNRMFEYALVYDTKDTRNDLQIAEIPLAFFLDSLKEHADFLHLAGFETNLHSPSSDSLEDSLWVTADPAMVKRVLNNLFSNIIKYADKKESVSVSVFVGSKLAILQKNHIRSSQDDMKSTQIGLQSARKIMEQMNGTLTVHCGERVFTAELKFPLHGESAVPDPSSTVL